MIDLFYSPTPNGQKITLMLEELGIDYRIVPINIRKDDQFDPDFLKISPNNRIPAIIDHKPINGGKAMPLFESGAILEYLADKNGRFLPTSGPLRYEALQWLHWQMGGIGPMVGQNFHFNKAAPEKIPYAIERYVNETKRLYGVLDKHLKGKEFVAGDYSIADMALWPWINRWEAQSVNIFDWPNLEAWLERVAERPATERALDLSDAFDWDSALNEDGKASLKAAIEAAGL